MSNFFKYSIRRKNSILLKIIIFLVVLFLSFGIRFLFSNNISEELFNKGIKEISIRNNHIFTENNKKLYKQTYFSNYPSETSKLFEEFIRRIDDIVYSEEAEFGYYSLFSSVVLDSSYTYVIGASNQDFYEQNRIKIIDGRLPEKGEEEERYALIYEGKKDGITGEEIKVGDFINISFEGQDYDYEIIGVYEVDYKYDYDVGTNDVFINRHLTIISEENYLKMIKNTSFFNYSYITVNNVVVGAENYSDYLILKEKMNSFAIDFQDYCRLRTMTEYNNEIEYCESNINISSYEVDALINSAETMNKMYIIIGLCCSLVAIMNFISLLSFMIGNERKDIKILQSLGMKKNNVIKNYVFIVWFNTIIPFLAGIIGSCYLQNILVKRNNEMVNSYYEEIMTYEGQTIKQGIELAMESKLFDVKVFLLTVVIVLVIETVVTTKRVKLCMKTKMNS